jgi:xanthine/CO dehydrogenase XdhC/CoxF family maturation factor
MTDTAEEDGMVCGGRMEVLIERTKHSESRRKAGCRK